MVGGQCLRLARATVVQEFGHMSPCNVFVFFSFFFSLLSLSVSFSSSTLFTFITPFLLKLKKKENSDSYLVNCGCDELH